MIGRVNQMEEIEQEDCRLFFVLGILVAVGIGFHAGMWVSNVLWEQWCVEKGYAKYTEQGKMVWEDSK